jgi:hypothetical protein
MASRYGHHDYSQPPHSTPDDPRDAEGATACQLQIAAGLGPCEHERRYEMIIYQPGTHDWIRVFACIPCTATLRSRPTFGPGGSGSPSIARIRDAADLP